MDDLKSLTERYFRHPDDGGDYLSVAELNLLCGFQHVEIVGMEAEIERLIEENENVKARLKPWEDREKASKMPGIHQPLEGGKA